MSRFFNVLTRVQWADTDTAGVVWMGNFLRYCELAEDELFRATGETRVAFCDRFDIYMPRVQVAVRFSSPARAEDFLQIGIRPELASDRRIRYTFQIHQHASADLVATASYEVACVNRGSFRPQSFPPDVVRQLSVGFAGLVSEPQ